MGPHPVKIRAAVVDRMLCHARVEWPLECCGLLAGTDGMITAAFPATNALASPCEFFVDAAELIGTLRRIRESDLKHLGIYHSHPDTENVPSARDAAMAFYPSCTYFIVSPHSIRPLRAFEFVNGKAAELDIEVV